MSKKTDKQNQNRSEAVEVFERTKIISTDGPQIVMKCDGLEIFFNKKTGRYDGWGLWIGKEETFKLPQRKRAS